MNPLDVLFVIAGLALLIAGGEALVRRETYEDLLLRDVLMPLEK